MSWGHINQDGHRPPGGKPWQLELSRARSGPAWRGACRAIEERYGVPVAQSVGVLRGGQRLPPQDAYRRKLALYVTVVGMGICVRHAALVANLTRKWLDEAIRSVEDMREDPAFEAEVDELIAVATAYMLEERGWREQRP